MPNTKSAKRALRKNQRRRIINLRVKKDYKGAIRKLKKAPNQKTLTIVYSKLDKAAKKKVIKKGKSARLKRRLARYVNRSES